MKKYIALILFNLILGKTVISQTDSLLVKDMETVTVSAPKISTELNRTPFSISKYTVSAIQESQQQLSLQEFTNNIPGMFTMNANNYAQDLRVSIRGFGARSAFGIRGIKIIVDGIPETTPDGQGQVDNLNLGIIQTMEIIRGPASALYGNASGGVIGINTINEFEKNFLKAGVTIGAFNMQQYQFTTGVKTKNTKYILHGNRTSSTGYREHISFENNNFNARIFHDFSEQSKLNILVNYANSQKAEDPGGIDLDAVNNNRRQAREQNILFDSGEEINQLKIGLNYQFEYNKNSRFNTYTFYSTRNFSGRLPFEDGGIVDLSRKYAGLGGNYYLSFSLKNANIKTHAGYEMATQADNRLRFNNLNGEKGDLSFEQLESFTSAGGFLTTQLNTGKWLISAGLRYDWNNLNADDRMHENGNDSGEKTYRSWNPSFGVSYNILADQYIFTNFSTSFETPSLSELSANPSGREGLNHSLQPQQAKNFEIGIKGNISTKSFYELTLFHIDIEKELVPYELDTFPGRIFYRNSGTGVRNGIEFSFNQKINKQFNASINYTFSDFIYKEYELNDSVNYNGNSLPGIPKLYGSFSVSYANEKGFHVKAQARYIGELFVNDMNDISDKSYFLLNLNVGYKIGKGKFKFTPFFGINNILNTKYNDNIRINAFGGRYYEPGPELNIYGGVRFYFE